MKKRIQVLSAVVLLILAVCPLAQASSDCDFRYSNYARAVQLHDMGDYDAALRHYRCALEEDPDDAVIPILIANLHDDIAHAGSAWSADAAPTTAEILGLPPVSSWGERDQPRHEQDFQDLIVADYPRNEAWPGWADDARMTIAVVRNGNRLGIFFAAGKNSVRLAAPRTSLTGENDPGAASSALSTADKYIKSARIFVRNLDWARARIRFEQALDLQPGLLDVRNELSVVNQKLSDKRGVLMQVMRDA